MRFLFFLFFSFFLSNNAAFAETIVPQHLCPTHWWVGMKTKYLEILVHQKNIGACKAKLLPYKGVQFMGTKYVENKNYAFLQVQLDSEAQAGQLEFEFKKPDSAAFIVKYELKARKNADKTRIQGLTSADFVYLLMPDRFANGDPKNDIVKGMHEKQCRRDSGFVRHGGDLQGVINQLDYFQNLGVTALWMTPVFENNQPKESYHGYAFTDHYKIDPRLGTNELYQKLVDEAHAKGLKIVMDLVHNHIGNRHWLYEDLPAKDWVNQWNGFTRTTYRATTLLDPYASEAEKKQMSDGWFDTHMPDLNQRNQHVSNYLIENNIWWIEEYGIDAFRVDTYAYPDQDFMGKWAQMVLREYPEFGIFGETWVQGIGVQAFFAKNNVRSKELAKPSDNKPTKRPNLFDKPKQMRTKVNGSQVSYLPGVTDFQLYYAIQEGVTKDMGWTEGIQQVYHTLAVDYLYDDAFKNVVFLGNHDLSRIYSIVGEDLARFKLAVALQLTTRGIPQWYYGDEILMKNYASLSGVEAREDFPGGWAADKVNKFDPKNLSVKEADAFSFVRKLATFRKGSEAIKNGKMMQFVPTNGVYTYFRYTDEGETVMVMINTDKAEQAIEGSRFAERIKGFTTAENIETKQKITDLTTFKIPAKTAFILQLGN